MISNADEEILEDSFICIESAYIRMSDSLLDRLLNARSTIFLTGFNLLIVILSSFCRWIRSPN